MNWLVRQTGSAHARPRNFTQHSAVSAFSPSLLGRDAKSTQPFAPSPFMPLPNFPSASVASTTFPGFRPPTASLASPEAMSSR